MTNFGFGSVRPVRVGQRSQRQPRPVVLLAIGAAVVLAACSDGTTAAQSVRDAAPTAIGAPAALTADGAELTLTTIQSESAGELITDYRGFAVYGNRQERPDALVCVETECTDVWIPLQVRDLEVAAGLDPDKLSVLNRDDGNRQVVYDGVALYLWSGDRQIGIAAGAGVAGTWFALTATGARVTSAGLSGP